MNKQEILQKAIEKAVEGGWKIPTNDGTCIDMQGLTNKEGWFRTACSMGKELNAIEVSHLIFSHDFAKAFWGEDKYESYCSGSFACPIFELVWKYHLTKMVLEEEPVGYLRPFLPLNGWEFSPEAKKAIKNAEGGSHEDIDTAIKSHFK